MAHRLSLLPAAALALVCGLASAAPPSPAPSAPSAMGDGAPSSAMEPTSSAAEIDAAIARLAASNPMIRRAGAQTLVNTSGDALPLLETRLLRPPEAGPGPMWLVLDRARKSLTGDSTTGGEGDGDLLLTLTAVVDAGNSTGARSLALLLAGVKACERQGGVMGARVLVRIALENKGIVKGAATAALKRMGDPAVAALLEVRRAEDRELRGWANKALDALGKFLPSDAVQVRDPQALADVLVAFGKTRDPDAIRAIITYLNADRAAVRDAARWAIAQFGDLAKAQLKEVFDNFTGDRAGDDWPAERTLKGLLAAYDKVRLADVFKLLDEGNAHRDAGRLVEAIASYDALLARAPTFERRAELAPAYADLARKRLPGDRAAARTLFAKSARLAVGTPLAASLDSQLALLDALDLLDRGIPDVSLLQRAIALDPFNVAARDALTRLDDDARARDSRLRRISAAIAVGILVTVAAILFAGRRHPPRRVRHLPT